MAESQAPRQPANEPAPAGEPVPANESRPATAAQLPKETGKRGEFVRQANRFTDRVTTDASSGWSAEPDRYRLVWSRACPWAHRAVIVRQLLGLDDAISLATVDPIRDERGWRFTRDAGGRDPVLDIEFLAEAYHRTDPTFEGRVTVPCLIDVPSGTVVTNDFPQITLDFSTQWKDFHRPGAPDLYPEDLREEIDQVAAAIYDDVNNGVYKCGFASSQRAYERAFDTLFARLDWLEDRLRNQRYLCGDGSRLTEADIRLFTTLVRFDAVYHNHFRCNRNKLTEQPVLWAYARDLYQTPGIGETVDFDQIKRHYYLTHHQINPTGVVPKGPDPTGWTLPHGRG
ncbi:glutathione S-transferase C-terminal domain-containing protein [Actinopolymorpha sp. B17G11]|uniref:glutathione S-transferase family protein n=1 Tax=Actinopolymorpha sp. B17G11 TaxID=3160861 RepID=UPI0032E375E3